MNLETDRLLLRKATLEDAEFFVALLNDENYIKGVRDSGVRTIADAEEYLRDKYFKGYEVNGFGIYLVWEKQLGKAIGVCGFVKRDGLEVPDLAYGVLTGHARQGYIHEAGKAMLSFGKQQLNFTTVGAIVNLDNQASVAVARKLGFHFVKVLTIPGIPVELQYFECNL